MDMLAIEARLGDGGEDSPAGSPQKLPSAVIDHDPIEVPGEGTGAGAAEPFHASKKSNTLKKYYKKLFKKPKDREKHAIDDEPAACDAEGGAGASAPPASRAAPLQQQLSAARGDLQPPGEQHLRPVAAPPAREMTAQEQPERSEAGYGAAAGACAAAEDGDEATSASAPAPPPPVASPPPALLSGAAAAAPSSLYSTGRFDTIGSGRYDPAGSDRYDGGAGGRFEAAGSGRHDYSAAGGDDGASSVGGLDSRMSTYSSNAGSMSGTIKGFLGPRKKKSKQYELDALRMEMEMLQERCSAAENNLSSASHDVNALRADRDALQQQLRERTVDLTNTRAAAAKAEEEVARLKTLHSQVKGALQGAYSQNQELSKQIQELESLCSAQQSSLEEAEERYRGLADAHDGLRHSNLQTKAQLVTAQAQVSELRAAREELGERVAALEKQAATLKADIEARAQSARELAASKASLEAQMEGMLGRLRELEAEKQQLEARQILLQEENLDLGRQVEALRDEGRDTEARLARMQQDNTELMSQLDHAIARAEALSAEKQRSLAERDGLAAELRSSADLREVLRARNDELAAEVGSLREAAAAKKGSPLRWRRAPKAAAAAAPGSRDGASSPDFGPMTKQRPGALFGARAPAAIGGGSGSGAGQQLVAMGPRGLTHESSGDVTAHVTAGDAAFDPSAPPADCGAPCGAAGASGRLPAPLCSASPDLLGPKGPLATGRTAGRGGDARGSGEGGSAGGFLGNLFGCFSPPAAAAHAVEVA